MARIPTQVNLSRTASRDIINTILNDVISDVETRTSLTGLDNSDVSLRMIGDHVMGVPGVANAFLNALVNKIGKEVVTSKMYSNPWAVLKKGIVELGEVVQETFVNLAVPKVYNAQNSEAKVFAREIPDVKTAFHPMNYKIFYKTTIQRHDLERAFLTSEGIMTLIEEIISSLVKSGNYDEFISMKYLLSKCIVDNFIKPISIPAVTEANANSIVSIIRRTSNNFEFLNNSFMAREDIKNNSMKNDQLIIMSTDFDAYFNVVSLASAFNMEKREFAGRQILVDSYSQHDEERLAILFEDDPNYAPFTTAEKATLDKVNGVIMDENFMMIFDNLITSGEITNPEGLYYNHTFHTWKTMSVSPFSKAAVFVTP